MGDAWEPYWALGQWYCCWTSTLPWRSALAWMGRCLLRQMDQRGRNWKAVAQRNHSRGNWEEAARRNRSLLRGRRWMKMFSYWSMAGLRWSDGTPGQTRQCWGNVFLG